MIRIAQRQLRNEISAVLQRAQAGERFEITVAGRPVAELGPLDGARAPAAPERLAEILSATPVDSGWSQELRAMRDEDAAAGRDPWAE